MHNLGKYIISFLILVLPLGHSSATETTDSLPGSDLTYKDIEMVMHVFDGMAPSEVIRRADTFIQSGKTKEETAVIAWYAYNYYRSLSAQFFQYLHRYSNMIEPASIDECFMDVTDTIKRYKRPLDLAVQIQNGVYETLGLNVSIGVAPNRFLAKMASDKKKPKGITVLRKAEIERKLWPLPIEEMVGIGKKTIPVLKRYGIQTIGDFASPDNENLILRLLSKSGYSLIQKARGNSSAQLNFSTTHKSISISRTYPSDIYTLNDAMERLKTLTNDLCRKMIQENQKGKLVSISLRDTNFHNIVRSVPLQTYTNAYVIVFEAASGLLEENFEEVGYRHIGVSMGSLKDANRILEQPSIFETPIQDTDSILAQLNKKLDHKDLFKASDLLKKGNEHE